MAAASNEATAAQAKVQLTLGDDRRWSFALAGLSTSGKTQDREDHCGSNGDFLHDAPISTDRTLQDKKDAVASLVHKSHSLHSICGELYDGQPDIRLISLQYRPFWALFAALFCAQEVQSLKAANSARL